ncbi:MAG: NAD(P)/FAD-dependent oxidoreductase, partial [Alphaproteobacteria bacterium]|nr:NAD(P)/FAD-dependent oxidoreductase [Alphaproteobacteria bacterium]
MFKKSILLLALSFSINTHLSAEKIAILGGGLSGLTAAYELIKNDVHKEHEIVLFEGRDRLGGRVHTHYFDKNQNSFYEEGGTFIDSDHKQITAIAEELNIPLKKISFVDKHVLVVNEERFLKIEHTYNVVKRSVKFLEHSIKKIEKEESKGLFWSNEKQMWVYKKAEDYFNELDEDVKRFLETYYYDETGINLEQMPAVSFYWINDNLKEYKKLLSIMKNNLKKKVVGRLVNKFAYHSTVEGGMSQLINALENVIKDKVTINLNSKIVSIKKEDTMYRLGFENGEEFTADRIIVTLPFSTLRHVNLADVPLTDLQRLAIQTLPYGQHIKVGIPIDADKDIAKDLLYYVDLDHKFIGWSGQNAMTFFIGSSKSQNYNQDNIQGLVNALMPGLQSKYNYVKDFGEPLVKNWVTDPFALGSYSGNSTECNVNIFNLRERNSSIRVFAEPSDDNRFFLAGEHIMADGSAAHMEGAVRSGKIMAGF